MSQTALPTDVAAELIAHGDTWHPRWAACTNAVTDDYGNTVAINDDGETLLIEFEYALGGSVETLHLDPKLGAARVAAVIATLAAPPL